MHGNTGLATQIPFASRSLKPKPKPKFTVTILLGLICRDALIVASDSRTTLPDGTFTDRTQKVFSITTGGKEGFLVATAGNADLGARVVEILTDKAQGVSQTHRRTVADLVEAAVKEVKDKLRAQFHGTAPELQQHFRDYEFELMLAHYYQGAPQIFLLNFESGIAVQRTKPLVAAGCGRLLAEFCLDGLDVSQMSKGEPYATALYAVEQVSKFDSRCGGRVQLARCWSQVMKEGEETKPYGFSSLVGETYSDLVAGEVRRLISESNARWRDQLKQVIDATTKRIMESHDLYMKLILES